MKAITQDGWTLVHGRTGVPVQEGEVVRDFRGKAETIKGGRPPHKPESTGHVWVGAYSQEYYPSVFDLRWIKGESK